MNMFKKNGGFTLVELIVVIAILAILAGVAVPAYNGYITKAQDAAVITELSAIHTAAQAANATAGEIDKIEVSTTTVSNTTTTTVTVTGDPLAARADFLKDFKMFYDATCTDVTAQNAAANTITIQLSSAIDLANTSYANGATWSDVNGKWAPTTTMP